MIRHFLRTVLLPLGLAVASTQYGFAQTPIQVPGLLKFEAYTNLTGTAVAGLTGAPEYPAAPAETLYMAGFDTRSVYPTDIHENYGARITGLITPTVSGDYEFFLRSDDAGELYLSTDSDPANLSLIAQETGCCDAFLETGAPETSAPQSLVAGQSYAIQVLYKEGGGGDYAQVAWRLAGDTTPAADLRPIPAAYLSSMINPGGTITITKQPVIGSIAENDTLLLSVDFTATLGSSVVQWQKDGVSIPGLAGGSVKYGPVKSTDNGAKFRALISIPGAFLTSSEGTLTVTPDVTRPSIRSALSVDTFNALKVEFSEPVTDTTAGDPANYTVSGGVQVLSVTVVTPTQVRLETSTQTPSTEYTLTVANVRDTANNAVAAGTKVTFSSFGLVRGGLKFESYRNIAGTAVSGLLASPNYPASPDEVAYVTSFTSRNIYTDAATVENYGGRISGWIVPAETSEYEFFIRSDDGGQLSLSTDEDPANAVVIASEATCCGPFEEPGAPETSAPISLEAGKRYYIEALWKEGGGGDYCDVAWRKVGDTTAAKFLPYISGAVLETYAAPGTFTPPTVAFTSPANNSGVPSGSPVVLTATATANSGKTITKIEFFEAGQKLGEATSAPYTVTLLNVRDDKHVYIARATDSTGMTADSSPLGVSVGDRVVRVTELLIDAKTLWRYDRSGQDLLTEWSQPDYDDSAWPQGAALIADETTTTVEPIRTPITRFNDEGKYVQTFYFRTHFNFPATSTARAKIRLRHVVDDGAAFYLNGERIHVFGLPDDFNATTSATGHENVYDGPFDISIDHLRLGDNVLAAEVHQSGGSSSDVVFGAELIISVPESDAVVTPVLTVSQNGNSVRVSWAPAGGSLQSAPSISGPWTSIANAANPYSATTTGSAQFFRVVQ